MAIALLTILAAFADGGPVHASCAARGSEVNEIRSTPVVFVGTATTARQRGSYTRFRVEEVWYGPDLAPVVWVQGGQNQGPWPRSLVQGTASSVDAHFERGTRYLVGADGTDFRTNSCSVSQRFDDRLRAAAPAAVRPPLSGGLAGVDPPPSDAMLNALASSAVLGVAVFLLIGWRRRRAGAS